MCLLSSNWVSLYFLTVVLLYITHSSDAQGNKTCNLKPIKHEPEFYHEPIEGRLIRRQCAPGVYFNLARCGCFTLDPSVPEDFPDPACLPDVYLPFTSDISDESGQNTDVYSNFIAVADDVALFMEQSYLLIQKFSGTKTYKKFNLRFWYKLSSPPSSKGYALVSNGCGENATVIIARLNTTTHFKVLTTCNETYAVDVPHGMTSGWEKVQLRFADGFLTGIVNNQTRSIEVEGDFRFNTCALRFGEDNGYTKFSGLLDEVRIFAGCSPNSTSAQG